jgi:hypothetical protein
MTKTNPARGRAGSYECFNLKKYLRTKRGLLYPTAVERAIIFSEYIIKRRERPEESEQ